MSAGVAIIKNDCVVLAADSAVTIGNKHYNTDRKLFQLAENLPVGVMFFGSGTICGVDLATLLKMFRQQIRQTPKQNLKDYPAAFIDFLKANVETLFPLPLQLRQLRLDADGWATAFLNALKKAVDGLEDAKYDAKKKFLTDKEIKTASCRVIQARLKALREKPPCWNVGDVQAWLVAQVSDQIRESIKDFFNDDGLIKTGEDLLGGHENLLIDLLVEDCLRRSDRAGSSGVVFAGYGSENVHPAVVCLKLDGIANNQVKFRYDDHKSFSVSETLLSEDCRLLTIAEIIPYAQADEMVELYTEGIPFAFHCHIENHLKSVLAEYKVSDKKSKAIVKSLDDEINKYSHENYGNGLLGNIGHLPPEETAQLAELLIKLTAFRQHVADQEEDVGEPIDVAVISKADGLVWHKRKNSLIQP